MELVDGLHRHDGLPTPSDEQACYVYVPYGNTSKSRQRPKKKRKVSHPRAESKAFEASNFVPLLNGRETPRWIALRAAAYESAWTQQKALLEEALDSLNANTVESVAHFLTITDPKENTQRIPTGFISAGLPAESSRTVFTSLIHRIKADSKFLMLGVTAAECPNLKSALKSIIQAASGHISTVDDKESETIHHVFRLLNYDLQILYEHVKKNSIDRVVIYFQSSESLDGVVLADLVDVFSAWQDRIPLMFLFEIAISFELFQEKLSLATKRRLLGTVFETRDAVKTLELMLRAATAPRDSLRPYSGRPYIGPNLLKILFDRQMEHIQSCQAFIRSLQYAYMTHYFVNPMSCLFIKDNVHGEQSEDHESLSREHCEAIRSLPSFRRHLEDLVEKRQLTRARIQQLLGDDTIFRQYAINLASNSRTTIRGIIDTLDMIHSIEAHLISKIRMPWSKLYFRGMSGDLAESGFVEDFLQSVKKVSSDTMRGILESIPRSSSNHPVAVARSDLAELLQTLEDDHRPLRSAYDIHHETLRTTIVAQKVQLSKHKAALSKEDSQYSKIVDSIIQFLETALRDKLIDPKELPLHELCLFDLKSPCREVFSPVPRQALERALNAPHDYLDCECCDGKENRLSSTQPATAVLYQLYLESGAIINISDLWSAFNAILGCEDGENEEKNEKEVLALFYRALAELKYLGMIKNSRRKVDHLTKLSWKGL